MTAEELALKNKSAFEEYLRTVTNPLLKQDDRFRDLVLDAFTNGALCAFRIMTELGFKR